MHIDRENEYRKIYDWFIVDPLCADINFKEYFTRIGYTSKRDTVRLNVCKKILLLRRRDPISAKLIAHRI